MDDASLTIGLAILALVGLGVALFAKKLSDEADEKRQKAGK